MWIYRGLFCAPETCLSQSRLYRAKQLKKRRRNLLTVWSPRRMNPIAFYCFRLVEHEHPMTEAVIRILLCAVASLDLKFGFFLWSGLGRIHIERKVQESLYQTLLNATVSMEEHLLQFIFLYQESFHRYAVFFISRLSNQAFSPSYC